MFIKRNYITVFDCAIAILHDQCPFDRDAYFCRRAEDPNADETICTRCWEDYLFKVQNGETDGEGKVKDVR